MSALFDANLTIIRARWPSIGKRLEAVSIQAIEALEPTLVEGRQQTIAVCGKQLSSRHDRDGEARLLLSHVNDDASPLHIFGMGLGDVPALALQSWPQKSITLNLLSLPITAMVLHYTDQTHWLSANNLNLGLPDWTDCYQSQWCALVPELLLADREFFRVRDHLQMELQRPFVDAQHQQINKAATAQINESITLLQSREDVATLFNQQHAKAVVVGTGPSLEQAYPWLKAQQEKAQQEKDQQEKAHLVKAGQKKAEQKKTRKTAPLLIIAADTAQKALLSHGITPDIVVTLDAKIGVERMDLAQSKHSTLVCFPSTSPDLIKAWQGSVLAALTKSPTQDGYAQQLPVARLFSGGSVIHPVLDIAVLCGATDVVLCGCDFGFPSGKSHAFWQDGALGVAHDKARHSVDNYQGEPIPTTLNMRTYLLAVELFIKRHPSVRFFNLSGAGAKIEGCKILTEAHIG